MSATLLQIYLFGPLQVHFADKPLSTPRSQTRALLYHLAVRMAPVQRDHLCFLFWPDVDDVTARRLDKSMGRCRRFRAVVSANRPLQC